MAIRMIRRAAIAASRKILALATIPASNVNLRMGVLEAETTAQVDTVFNAGANSVMIDCYWDREQPNSGALDATAVAARNAKIDYAISKGMAIHLRIGTQYPPAWVLSSVPKFKAQDATTWDSTNPGEQVRDWVFSEVGKNAIHDFATRAIQSLGSTRLAALTSVQTGIGFYGETQYPRVNQTATLKWWGFSDAAQTGTGRASDIPACPTPGHIPFDGVATGTVGSATTLAWVDWYRNAIRTRMNSFIGAIRAGGWTGLVHVLHPSFGVRSNWTSADFGWREQNAQGVDWNHQIAGYLDANVFPWGTDAGAAHAWHTPTVDSDYSPAAKLSSLATTHGKTAHLGGENTGGGTLDDQNRFFDNLTTYGYKYALYAFYSTLDTSGDTLANFTTRLNAINGGSATPRTITPADNMQSMASVNTGKFRTWLNKNGATTLKGMMGEFGVPNDRATSEQAQWNGMLDVILHRMYADQIGWTFWATGHHWGTGYNVGFYENSGTAGAAWSKEDTAATIEAHYADQVFMTGGNYAGHEFFNGSTAPALSDWQYHKGVGMNYARYPLGPAFLYPTAGGALDATNLQHVKDMLDRAGQAGMKILLDVLHPGSGNDYVKMFGVTLNDATAMNNYKDYVSKLLNSTWTQYDGTSRAMKNHPALWGVDMVNEPAHVTPAQWQTISQDIYNWLRNTVQVPTSKYLAIPIASYSGVHSIDSYHPGGPWLVPVAGDTNFFYEAHFYPNYIGQYGQFDGTFNNPDGTPASYSANISSASSFSGQGAFTYTPGPAAPVTPDTTAPSAVTLSQGSKTDSSVTLNWTAATDNVGIASYKVYDGSTEVGSVSSSTLTFTHTGLTASSSHSYTVRAYDAAGNYSTSGVLGVTTDAAPVGGTGVAFDTHTPSAPGSNYAQTRSVTHTASGTNRLALVAVGTREDVITSVTYGGVAMTTDASMKFINPNIAGVQMFYLVNPPTGAQTVTVNATTFKLFMFDVATFTGVHQTNPLAGSNKVDGWGNDPSLSVPTTVAEAMIVHALNTKVARTIAPNASGGTERADFPSGDANLGQLGVATLTRTALTGSVGWTVDAGDNWSMAAIALRPA